MSKVRDLGFGPSFMPDKDKIAEAVGDKFIRKAFEAVVSATFISALPLSDEEKKDKKNIRALKSFASAALESAGGYQLLLNAIQNEKNPSKLGLLKDINSICYTTATEAAARYALEATDDTEAALSDAGDDLESLKVDVNDDTENTENVDDETTDANTEETTETPDETEPEKPEPPKKKILKGKNLSELTLDARMTDNEYSQLAKKAENIEMDQIAEIVNDKIVKAVTEEKKTYEKVDAANDRLKAALIERDDIIEEENPDAAKEAVERVYRLNFSDDTPREHKSLFTALQSKIAENVIATESISLTEFNPELCQKVMCRTLPHTFTEKVTLSSAIEEALSTTIALESWTGDNCNDVIKFASLATIVIMTFLETLNTMNINVCNKDDIRAAVDGNIRCCSSATDQIANNVNASAKVALDTIHSDIKKTNDISDLENAMEKTILINSKLTDIAKKGHPVSPKVFTSLESIQTEIKARLAKVDKNFATATEAISYSAALKNDEARRAFESTICRVKDRIQRRWPDRLVVNIKGNNVHTEMITNRNAVDTEDINIGCALEGITATDFFKTVAKMNGFDNIILGNRKLPVLIIDENGRSTLDD